MSILSHEEAELIDHLSNSKSANYHYGHQYPDKLLIRIAKKDPTVLVSRNFSENFIIKAINSKKNKDSPFILNYVENQTEAICIAAIENNPDNFHFVKNKTFNICLAAIKKSAWYFKLINNPSDSLCIEGIKNNIGIFKLIKNPSQKVIDAAYEYYRERNISSMYDPGIDYRDEEVCLEIVKNYSNGFARVKNKSFMVCLSAVKAFPFNLNLIDNPSEDFCIKAIKSNIEVFKFINNPSDNIINAALKCCGSNYSFFQYIPNLNVEYALALVKEDPFAIYNLQNITSEIFLATAKINSYVLSRSPLLQTKEIIHEVFKDLPSKYLYDVIDYIRPGLMDDTFYEELVKKDGLVLQSIKQRTPKIELLAVQQNWRALQYATYLTEELCVAAYDQDIRALRLMWNKYSRFKSTGNFNRLSEYFCDNHNFPTPGDLIAFDTERRLSYSIETIRRSKEDALTTTTNVSNPAQSLRRKASIF